MAKGPRKVTNTEQLECEVVIIGGGGSGLTAAVAAAEKGAGVIVLEKQETPGGNAALATGLFATETKVQERLRLLVSTDDVFRFVMNYSHLEIDPRIMRAFLYKASDTIQWLEKKGIEFDGSVLFYADTALPVYHCPVGGHGGSDIVKTLVKNAKDLGVQIFCQTPVVKILQDKKGKVTGVLATAKGRELSISAKCVIVATGGHGSNIELLKKYHASYSEDLVYLGTPHSGDGIMLADEVGANTDGWGSLIYHGPMFPLPIQSQGGTYMRYAIREPYTIWVNKKGERFVDEACRNAPVDTANALHQQPGKVSYTLFDTRIKTGMMEDGFKRGGGYRLRPGTKPTGLEEEFQSQAGKGFVVISRSWDEIAAWIGSSPKKLKATVDEYNHFCDQGYDQDFLKDRRYLRPLRTPPFYAIKGSQAFLDTMGGIKINHFMEVLDHKDQSIPGLYAVGVTTSGWEPRSYCVTLAGNAFGFAVNSGRIAGENAVKYAKKQMRQQAQQKRR